MGKRIVWTEHARFRMHLRHIPRAVVEEVLANPLVEATDTLTGYSIAVGEGSYAGKGRTVAVTYEETGHSIEIVTAHPIRASQYRMRLQRGRWKLT